VEAKTLMAGYLLSSQGDRMLLANSVEGRFPFLDHRVIEFASRLHPRLKMKVLCEKYLLKRAAGHYLPDRIVERCKQPYRAPDIPAFFGSCAPAYVDEMLGRDKIKDYGYFDSDKVEMLRRKIDKGRAVGYKDNMALVGILSTQLWHWHFVDRFAENFKKQTSTD
jgi:asparagine synthase (glutamine-hydrolysing)